MAPTVLHHPRVAWDTAQVLVAAAGASDEVYVWFSARLGDLLGMSYRRDLYDARMRLADPTRRNAVAAETGLWRVRFEDLLRGRPDLADDLRILHLEGTAKLGR